MITWFEIQVPDMKQAQAFYGGVFGWTFKEFMEGYDAAYDGEGKMVCGMTQAEGEASGRQIHVVFDLSAKETLEQTLAKVIEHGGTIKAPRTQISEEMGWYATVADPSGLSFDFWTADPEK